jgi:hypothetical protein
MSLSKSRVLSIFAWLLICLKPAVAYELKTHWEISGRAFDESRGMRSYLKAIAVTENDTFDPSSASLPRQLKEFKNTGTPRDWMIEVYP